MTASLTAAALQPDDRAAVDRLDHLVAGPGLPPQPGPDVFMAVLRGESDDSIAGCVACGPAAELEEPALAELSVVTAPGLDITAVPASVLDEAVSAAAGHGATRVVTTTDAGAAETAGWLARNGFEQTGESVTWERAAGGVLPEPAASRFQFRPFEPGEYTADALVGLASATFGTTVFPAGERLVARDDTVRRAVFGGTVGRIHVAIDGWPAVGWSVLSTPSDGHADLVLTYVQPGYEGQGVAGGLVDLAARWADEHDVALRTTVDPNREKELSETLPRFGFREARRTMIWQRTAH
jgi:GNAT superfamily N-acetyltransferase